MEFCQTYDKFYKNYDLTRFVWKILNMIQNKMAIKERTKIETKTAENTDKKTGFKPKAWAVKFVKEHKVLMDLLKDK